LKNIKIVIFLFFFLCRINKDEAGSNAVPIDGMPIAWLTNAKASVVNTSNAVTGSQQQQLLCITFTTDDSGQTQHTQSTEPIFIDVSF